ncbi:MULTISPECIES: flagellar biosynthesis protein FlgC [Methylobacterium]|jgi:flagellar basal-body rod protein FlgC|uniref:Flagellar basal-body rod protein FlgC n=2 Tax=Methylobacterium TaxID=407 RepID=A0A509EG86_9HYPH|nr:MULTISPECIES: flagellar biosynthesis protein FlgC [Methylobacterium]MBY0252262.1 flagellar biosynthesis protein FlgC [Methylobacterium organophilum]AYO86497.1 flagellar biosynthesis protein FlgC [Methylobacterium brachiatum]MCB4806361.1 flagellar biosynthesis protein FlgC [Methylobacterium brachiatum]MDQ0547283.1 flagellar basal-body rod protein FlgC [Methylobacterium brachiatum]VUD73377.1 Flagellar basal-body rod protein FlgC [Methylobacterium symbioticum]
MPEVNSLKSASDILAAGRKIQQGQIRTISENIANANATANNPGGVPYSRKIAVFSPIVPDSDDDPVGHIVKDTTPFRTRYDPSNVAASENGFVMLPNVDTMVEFSNFQAATRSYELSYSASSKIDAVTQATIDLLK